MTRLFGQAEVSRSRLCQFAPGALLDFQEPSVTSVSVLPAAVVTVSLAIRPVGPGAPFCTSQRKLFAPGLIFEVTSTTVADFQLCELATNSELMANLQASSAVTVNSAFLMALSAGSVQVVTNNWPPAGRFSFLLKMIHVRRSAHCSSPFSLL